MSEIKGRPTTPDPIPRCAHGAPVWACNAHNTGSSKPMNEGRVPSFSNGDSVRYYSVHNVWVIWTREADNRWRANDHDERGGFCTDNDVRDLLWARRSRGPDGHRVRDGTRQDNVTTRHAAELTFTPVYATMISGTKPLPGNFRRKPRRRSFAERGFAASGGRRR